jgi:ParB family transcriptional regulator, chromosome partitioning protein
MTAAPLLSPASTDEIAILRPEQIVPAPWGNVRVTPRSSESMNELLESVRKSGILQSVVVRPHPTTPDLFELLAGYGRHEVAAIVGCAIPAVIKHVADSEALAIGLKENLVRENMGPVDEARAAKMALSFCNGDYEEACLELGWSLVRLKQRLHLTRCIPAVLDALSAPADGGARLTLRHADLLAGVSEEAQGVLVVEILKKGISPDELKMLLGKATRPLNKARFDIADCAGCEHNTQQQHSLFNEFETVGAHCRNLVCFKDKTAQMVQERREGLTERYGKIILLSEADSSVVRNIDHAAVGANQFFGGCIECSHRVALLDDRMDTAGDVKEDYCTKLDCYSQCVKTEQAAQAVTARENKAKAKAGVKVLNQSGSAGGNETVTTGTAPQAASDVAPPSKSVECKLPQRVIEDNKVMLRKAAVEAWGSSVESAQAFQIAVLLASVKSLTGTAFPNELPRILKTMSPDEMRIGIMKAVKDLAEKAEHVSYSNMTDILISTLPAAPDAQTHAIANWVPTKERFTSYTKGFIEQILGQSGFRAAYMAEKGEKEFKKLVALGKPDFIKDVLAFTFDWSAFAPAGYISGF